MATRGRIAESGLIWSPAEHHSRALKLGFDASVVFTSAGGTRVYASQLLEALSESRPGWDYVLYVRNAQQATELQRAFNGPHMHHSVVKASPNVWRVQARLPARLRADGVDLYHSFGYFLPLAWRGPKVVTIHDVNMFQNWRAWMAGPKVLQWADLVVQSPLAARAAERVITDSQFSKRAICRLLRIPESKVDVIPLAPDPFFDEPVRDEEREEARAITGGEPFVLFVGVVAPQKNLAMLIRAFAMSGLGASGVRLVLAGLDNTGHGEELKAVAAAEGVGDRVVLPGFVSSVALRALYHEAMAVVLPSHGEGFGLPLVEAMACGAPVLAASSQALPEIVGDAGCLFDANDAGELAGLLKRLHEDDAFRLELRRRGLARRKQFSWRATAEATVATYEEALRSSR